MKNWLLILSFLFTVAATAQDGNYDAFLARQFALNGEYGKAAEYYADLFEQTPDEYYNDYLDVLIKLKDFEKAEKVIKTIYKKSGNNPVYLTDIASLYLQQEKTAEAEKQFAKIIKELPASKYIITQVAQRLIELKQYDYAEKAYLRGKEILKDKNAFNLEIAQLLLWKNDYTGMMMAYLDEAPYMANNLSVIQNGLQKGWTDEKAKDALEKELLKRTQSAKGNFVYQDLLVWLYMQRNDFDGAVIQAKSLDMLRNEDGSNVLRIGQTALVQKDYDAAIKAFQYVVQKGANYPWFVNANLALINAQRDKLVNATAYQRAQLIALKGTYQTFIQSYPNDYLATNATLELAQLEALYLHELDSAIARTLPIAENNRTPKDLLARAKLNLGDYYIMDEQPWESLLLYSQVEKEQKGNPIGEEAKFKNAKLAYFKGDFEWAQTQLKIIKASTTELISNDAIDLSVFILDNLNTDESDRALLKFAKSELLRYQHKLKDAEDTLNDILATSAGTALQDDILYLKYQLAKDRQQYAEAAGYLEQLSASFGDDILGDNALFYLGDLYQYYLKDEEKAKQYYERIILEYKDSTLAVEARKRFRKLRGDIP